MDALKKNAFWVVVGVIVAAAAGLFGYRWLVVQRAIDTATDTARSNKDQIELQILAQGNKAPHLSWVPVFLQQQQNAINERQGCYREYAESNVLLSEWADANNQPKEGAEPERGTEAWKARYRDRLHDGIPKELEAKGIKVGIEVTRAAGPGGFGAPGTKPAEEGGLAIVEPSDMHGDLKVFQKQWWIQERFIEAVLKSPNVVRVEKVDFPPEPPAPAVAADSSAQGGAAPDPNAAYVKPSLIRVNFQLQVMYGDISKFVANLIEFGKDGKVDKSETFHIRFRNVDLRVAKLTTWDQQPTDKEEIKEEAAKENFDLDKWKPVKDEPPKPVRLVVSAEVLDFSIPKEAYNKQQ